MSLEQRLYTAEGGAESLSKGGISRRAFLKASAAAGGGLLLSFRLPALMRNAEAAETPTANTFAPNAFIRIDRQGRVTLVVHQVEMGQGTYTSLPMLLAEELEVDLAQVQLEHAPPDDKLYANPLLGFQATGGSTSVRGAWEPLRRAGAAARSYAGVRRVRDLERRFEFLPRREGRGDPRADRPQAQLRGPGR